VVPVQKHPRGRLHCGPLLYQASVPPSKDPDSVGVEVDAPSAGARFDGRFDGAAEVTCRVRTDRHAGGGLVEVAPVESGEFAATDSGVGNKVQGWVEPFGLGLQ